MKKVRQPTASRQRPVPALTRSAFAKISEVEGIRLSADAIETFADFDRRRLSAEARRRAIIGKFRREAAE